MAKYVAENLVRLPLVPGQKVWLADGREGFVESIYVGAKGLQRAFVRTRDGSERINLKPKGIGKDIFLEKPKGGEAMKPKLITNVVKKKYNLLVTFSDGKQKKMVVEAESLSAAGLLLPMTAIAWEEIPEDE